MAKKPKTTTSSPGPADFAAERASGGPGMAPMSGGGGEAASAVQTVQQNFSENLQLFNKYPKEIGPEFVGFIETLKGGGKQGQPSQPAPGAPAAPGPAQPPTAPAPRPAAPAGIPQQ